jgi:predicted metal-binding protein
MTDLNTDPVTIHVCVSCRTEGEPLEPREGRAGSRLHAALIEAAGLAGAPCVRIVPVDCMSVCKRPVTVGFSSPGKWTYVYGDFTEAGTDASAAVILDGARRFAATTDGLIPWKERPQALKKGVIARLPPSA